MDNDIISYIVEERRILNQIRQEGKKSELISGLIELNNKIENSLYANQSGLSDSKPIFQEKEVNTINIEDKKNESFFQSKKLAKISNKIFGKQTEKLSLSMKEMGEYLKKANANVLLQTYLSISMFITLILFLGGIFIYFMLFCLNIVSINYVWMIIIPPLFSFILFFSFPKSEASNIQKKIMNELPFATIHMSAIAGSDMEPTKIFQIIAMSKEYDTIGKELKKILAQVNIYGYDLLTALTNVAKDVSNKRLSELLLGLATNISSGGSLKIYLEKKAETYLIDYKLSRKEYIEMAGTFMDIYISILIAAPLIMMLMFIIMSVSGLNVGGLSIQSLLFLTVGVVVMLNIVFIFVLNLKQPVV